MADKRISQLVDRGTVANNDVVPIVVSGATTTNKATISSIQTFMQGNLDVGVTSVGITLGSSGTDVSVSGSPITSSGNITINLPTASATNRGLLSAADWVTFNSKQDAGSFVTLDTTQTITAQKTFTTSGSSDTMIISHGSGSGFALDVLKAGNNEALRVTKTSGSGNAMTVIGGNFEAPTIVKTGGTSSQFLKADGSVDSNAYTTNTGTVTSVGLSSATSGVTIGSSPITTSGTITLAIATASGSQNGLLSSTDWTTFNNKQNALTNPVTGTGTANIIPKFTGGSTLGDSSLQNVLNSISNLNPPSGQFAWQLNGNATTGQSFGALVVAGTNASDIAFAVRNTGGVTTLFEVQGDGNVGIGTDSPAAELQVGKSSDVTIAMSNSSSVTSGNRGSLAWYNSSVSTVANIRAVAVTDNVGTQLEFYTRPAAGSLTQVLTLASTGAATFSSSVTAATLTTIGTAVAGQNVQLNLNGVSGKAQRIEFQNSGAQQWLLGAGAASETSAFELFNSTGVISLSINKSTNAATFTGALNGTSATFSSSVGVGGATNTLGFLEVWKSGGIAQFSIGQNATYHTDFFVDATGNFYLQPQGTTRLTISDSGAATFSSSVSAINYVSNTGSTNTPSYVLNRGSSFFDGVISWTDNASPRWKVGTFGTGSGDLRFYSANTGGYALTLNYATGAATFSSTVETTGIKFPATQVASADANTLDDYEEGTWTPTVTAESGSYTTIFSPRGTYTKIGRVVTLTYYFQVNNKGTGSNACILSSLPFASKSSSSGDIYVGSGIQNSSNNPNQIVLAQNSSSLYIYENTGDPITATLPNTGTITYIT